MSRRAPSGTSDGATRTRGKARRRALLPTALSEKEKTNRANATEACHLIAAPIAIATGRVLRKPLLQNPRTLPKTHALRALYSLSALPVPSAQSRNRHSRGRL